MVNAAGARTARGTHAGRARAARAPAWAALALIQACGFGVPARDSGISREEFIEAYAALRQAARDAGSFDDFEDRKRTILEERGVTAGDLVEFARAHGGDVPSMADLWDTLDARLTRPDTAAPLP